jgi:hypothetical protein
VLHKLEHQGVSLLALCRVFPGETPPPS